MRETSARRSERGGATNDNGYLGESELGDRSWALICRTPRRVESNKFAIIILILFARDDDREDMTSTVIFILTRED